MGGCLKGAKGNGLLKKLKLIVSQRIHIEYKNMNSYYNSVFTLNTKVKTRGITVYSHQIQKLKLIVSQRIHIEYKSENSWYHSVFTLNTKVKTYGITKYKLMKLKLMKYKLMKYKLMVSQCIHIEYKSKNSWYHSVFTLNTKVKTHEVKTHEVKTHEVKFMKLKLMVSQCIHIEYKAEKRGAGSLNRRLPDDAVVARMNGGDAAGLYHQHATGERTFPISYARSSWADIRASSAVRIGLR
ncbi:hypothetical protein OUZ56_026397 [Daphnia magna]|uniref:Uncharacterized protein n=1 Tax=Daphnia magna TaxID=35525 RepID=A0ABQ9ZLM1_9CRUS|nr:hypothetical protein OUZ56_026397 [Daphnia magna]